MELNKIYCGDCLGVMKTMEDNSVDSIVTDPPYELGFMGKSWDSTGIANSVEMWREALRVLKPGGHLLSFSGTRTYHRMAVAIEDAGFEVRDMVEWVYGSGFPKSLNIGKAVDKLQGNEREDLGKRTDIHSHGKDCRKTEVNYPTNEPRLTKGNSPYEGWGTALKPAHEPICLARKPLSEKTVAENVLKWNTGGINIDGCRVGTEDTRQETGGAIEGSGWGTRAGAIAGSSLGRFPANLIHDGSDEVVEIFPNAKGGAYPEERGKSGIGFASGKLGGDQPAHKMGDSGSAARFFYCAKASKSERNMGCEELGGGTRIRQGLAGEHKDTFSKNTHPTVKPIALMSYLIKLITPPNGIVLDPFAGSGSTLVAAKRLGFNFIGIEKEPDYVKIAEARIAAVPTKLI